MGFMIEDIRVLLALAVPGVISCSEGRALAAAHLENVRAKLADLIWLEAILTDTVPRRTGVPAPACPVLDMFNPSRTAALRPPPETAISDEQGNAGTE